MTSRLATGTAYQVDYNSTVAADWAATNCPGGPGRQFGACEADRGVVVQERAGLTHVLVVAFDVTVTTERGTHDVTLIAPVVAEGPDELHPRPDGIDTNGSRGHSVIALDAAAEQLLDNRAAYEPALEMVAELHDVELDAHHNQPRTTE